MTPLEKRGEGAVQYITVQSHEVQFNAMEFRAEQCSVMWFSAIWCNPL